MRTRMTYFSCFRCACTNVGFEYKCNRYTSMMIFATQWIETHLHAVCISVDEEEIIFFFFFFCFVFLHFFWFSLDCFLVFSSSQLWSLHVLHSECLIFLLFFFIVDFRFFFSISTVGMLRLKLRLWVKNKTIIIINNGGNRQTNSSTRVTSNEQHKRRGKTF